MGYRNYMNNHFDSCRLLAYAVDPHRERDVRLYMLPGQFEVVGVTDGTDAWIAPVVADPFSVGVGRILADIQAGKDPHPTPPVKLFEPHLQPATSRRRVVVEAAAPQQAPKSGRRSIITEVVQVVAPQARRRVIHAV